MSSWSSIRPGDSHTSQRLTGPRRLDDRILLAIHDAQLVRHGGAAGVRDAGLLESALAGPRNPIAYGECNLCAFAAAYGAGIARNPRLSMATSEPVSSRPQLLLREHGLRLAAPQGEAVVMTLGLASGELPEEGFAAWLRDRADPVGRT